ncbi:hypothetical protein B0A55_04142 [Friedmanniomyces simplex]|uniref:Uncharacterized protein n=1 Tax=Friedmanniomyces simplex TaxID=329884 RepID=A0A4U0XRG9_9PEZI|nr:hypothetical protein B0A55_04142 [Friedmanniomyces simplex]
MLAAFDNEVGEDFGAMADKIREVESRIAIKSHASRLLHRGDWYADTMYLLTQLPPDVLRAFTRNEVPQRAMRELRTAIRQVGDNGAERDPVIYANFCADKDGKGVPIDRFDELLTAIERVTGNAEKGVASLEGSQEDWERKVNTAYTTRGAQRTLAGNILFFDSLKSGAKNDDERQHARRELAKRARLFVDVNRAVMLPRARRAGVSHVALQGEVGLAVNGDQRLLSHVKVGSDSPALFRLVQLLLQIMFPSGIFRLHQVKVFTLTKASQAEIGETVASLLCGSYTEVGGMNAEQPGFSQSGITELHRAHWDAVTNTVSEKGFLRFQKGNLEAYSRRLRERTAAEKEQLLQHRRVAKFQENKAKLAEEQRKTAYAADSVQSQIEDVNEQLDTLGSAFADRQQVDAEHQASLEAMQELWAAIKPHQQDEGS